MATKQQWKSTDGNHLVEHAEFIVDVQRLIMDGVDSSGYAHVRGDIKLTGGDYVKNILAQLGDDSSKTKKVFTVGREEESVIHVVDFDFDEKELYQITKAWLEGDLDDGKTMVFQITDEAEMPPPLGKIQEYISVDDDRKPCSSKQGQLNEKATTSKAQVGGDGKPSEFYPQAIQTLKAMTGGRLKNPGQANTLPTINPLVAFYIDQMEKVAEKNKYNEKEWDCFVKTTIGLVLSQLDQEKHKGLEVDVKKIEALQEEKYQQKLIGLLEGIAKAVALEKEQQKAEQAKKRREAELKAKQEAEAREQAEKKQAKLKQVMNEIKRRLLAAAVRPANNNDAANSTNLTMVTLTTRSGERFHFVGPRFARRQP